jgi:hypothetical protein
MKKGKNKTISSEKFDQLFDAGKDVTPYLDRKSFKKITPFQRINIDIPYELLKKVDKEADRIGVARTALIKMWIVDRLDKLAA